MDRSVEDAGKRKEQGCGTSLQKPRSSSSAVCGPLDLQLHERLGNGVLCNMQIKIAVLNRMKGDIRGVIEI